MIIFDQNLISKITTSYLNNFKLTQKRNMQTYKTRIILIIMFCLSVYVVLTQSRIQCSCQDYRQTLNLLNSIKQQKQSRDRDNWICLGLNMFPILGSACNIITGIKYGDTSDIAFGVVFLGLDAISLGMGHYLSTAGQGVTQLARTVQQGGKIIKGIQVGSQQFRSLRLAAAYFKDLKSTFSTLSVLLSKIKIVSQSSRQVQFALEQNEVTQLYKSIQQLQRKSKECECLEK